MLMPVYTIRIARNVRMKVQDPPNDATASAIRSPKVISDSITSFGLRAARTRTSCCVA